MNFDAIEYKLILLISYYKNILFKSFFRIKEIFYDPNVLSAVTIKLKSENRYFAFDFNKSI